MGKVQRKKQKPERRQIGVLLNSELWRELKILALRMDKTAGEVLEEAISDYLKRASQK